MHSSTSTSSPKGSSNGAPTLDRFAWGIIRRKAREIVRRSGLAGQDHDDLVQELALRLLQSLPTFDPNKAHFKTFVTTVVERSAAKVLRHHKAQKRSHGSVASLEQLIEDNGEEEPAELAVDRQRQQQLDLHLDVQELLAGLPADLQDLAGRLQEQTLTEIAREGRVARSTLQRRRDKLRRCLRGANFAKS